MHFQARWWRHTGRPCNPTRDLPLPALLNPSRSRRCQTMLSRVVHAVCRLSFVLPQSNISAHLFVWRDHGKKAADLERLSGVVCCSDFIKNQLVGFVFLVWDSCRSLRYAKFWMPSIAFSSLWFRVRLSQPYIASGQMSALVNRAFLDVKKSLLRQTTTSFITVARAMASLVRITILLHPSSMMLAPRYL